MGTLRCVWSGARRTMAGVAVSLLLLPVAAPAQPAPPPPGDEVVSPPSASEKALTFSMGETFQLGPDPTLGEIVRVYIGRDVIAKALPLEPHARVARLTAGELGVTQVSLEGSTRRIRTYEIRVAPSVLFLREHLKRQFPRANVQLVAAGDNLLIAEGEVDSPADADEILSFLLQFVEQGRGRVINRMRVTGVMQVQLQVCIAKIDRTATRNLGVNFLRGEVSNFEGSQVGNLIGVPTINARGGPLGGAGVFSNFTGTGSGTTSVLSSNATLFFGLTPQGTNFFAFIEALQQQGVAKILATPTLITLNGRPADFLVGGEQPVPIASGVGVQPGVDYKPFGTRLTFVPVILGEGKIRLNIIPEVSRLTANTILVAGSQVPQFETQRINATVEMESGQTLALGGLLQTTEDSTVNKVPVLGDLPGAGVLFRRITHNKVETELLVVVTPLLIDPLRGCQRPPALPGQESRAPNDCELFLKGQIEVPVGKGAPPPPGYAPAPPPEPALPPLPPGVAPAPGMPH